MVCPSNQEPSDWRCAAFSPGTELAALSSTHLCIFDYSNGWSSEISRRTHSIFRYARPTGVSYMRCSRRITIVYDNGHMQIWNADSLTLDRRVQAHEGAVRCMDISPPCAKYDCR